MPQDLERMRQWKRENPDACRASCARRYARKVSAPGTCSTEQWEARRAVFGGRCWLRLPGCTGEGTEIDHVIPVARGGTNWPANLRPICVHCNRRKGTKDWRTLCA